MSVIKYKDSNGNYVKIPANVGINNVVEGYYNETDSKFYEESTYETEITAEENKIYISLDTDKSYYWDGSEYKLLSGGGGVSDFDDLTNRPLESDAINIEDLDLPMPAKPTEYPILFDETGTEYQVGLYKRASDGKVKTVYRKMYTILSLTPSSVIKLEDNIEYAVQKTVTYASDDKGGGYWSASNEFYFLKTFVNSSHELKINCASSGEINNVKCVVEYTKTTDEWKEV